MTEKYDVKVVRKKRQDNYWYEISVKVDFPARIDTIVLDMVVEDIVPKK